MDRLAELFPFVLVATMIVLPLTIVAAILLLMRLGRQMRSADMARLAPRLGLVFAGPDQAWRSRLPDLGHLTRGRHGKTRNLMQGHRDGMSITVYDTLIGVAGRPHRKPRFDGGYEVTVACLEIPALALPRFLLLPTARGLSASKGDHAWAALNQGEVLGALGTLFASENSAQPGGVFEGLAFASHPAFQERYSLRVQDVALARRFFTPPVLDHLLQSPGWVVEGGGPWLMVGRSPFLVQETTERGSLKPVAVEGLALGATQMGYLFLAAAVA